MDFTLTGPVCIIFARASLVNSGQREREEIAMWWIIFKYLTTAGVVVAVSEIAKHSYLLGAFIASLPLVTVMVLMWMFIEGQSQEKISNHAFYTFWYVLPSLPMFLIFPILLKSFAFWPSLIISLLITAALFLLCVVVVRWFGVELM